MFYFDIRTHFRCTTFSRLSCIVQKTIASSRMRFEVLTVEKTSMLVF
jgi:hypothetical protein